MKSRFWVCEKKQNTGLVLIEGQSGGKKKNVLRFSQLSVDRIWECRSVIYTLPTPAARAVNPRSVRYGSWQTSQQHITNLSTCSPHIPAPRTSLSPAIFSSSSSSNLLLRSAGTPEPVCAEQTIMNLRVRPLTWSVYILYISLVVLWTWQVALSVVSFSSPGSPVQCFIISESS